MNSVVNFSDIGKRQLLRLGARYVDFWKNKEGRIFDDFSSTLRLRDCVKFASSAIIKKDNVNETYQLIDLANIEPGTGYPINLKENIVDEIGSDKVYLEDAEIIFSKLNSHIGYVFLRADIPDSDYKLIGSTEFFSLKVDLKKIHLKLLKYLLLHKSFREIAVFLRTGKSQSHPRIQVDDFYNIRIPFLSNDVQLLLEKRANAIEKSLSLRRKKVESLQSIIDEVFTDYGLKIKSQKNYQAEILTSNLKDIGANTSERLGAQYNAFWLKHMGNLFEGTKKSFKTLPLKRVLRAAPKIIVKKGALLEPRILIDFDQIESPNGRITDFENIVSELGSDRIEFGNCDILTNKLRPYLGYTILNRPDDKLIGTTEFIPFEVKKKSVVLSEYLRYLMLSSDYLSKSKFLMSGKEHPRINSIDILKIRVPLPSLNVQRAIVREIKKREAKSQKARAKIIKLRTQIDTSISQAIQKA